MPSISMGLPSGAAVVTAPPEGATVVDLYDALYGDFPLDAYGKA